MAARSPNYPAIDLGTALEDMRPVFKAENRNKMSRLVLAQGLGYNSLNGRALAKIGAVRAYGLIEGSGDDLKVSDDCVVALMAPPESEERTAALYNCALKSSLFQDIQKDYPDTLPSMNNLTFWLTKRGFKEDAAEKAAKNYLSTMRLVGLNPRVYNQSEKQTAKEDDMPAETLDRPKDEMSKATTEKQEFEASGVRRASFPISEGDVTLIFPSDLSGEGLAEMKAFLDLFINQQLRRKDAADRKSFDDFFASAFFKKSE